MRTMQAACPREDVEQMCLFRWAAVQSGKYPALGWMYHVPNGGRRSKAEAGRFKAEGVRAGVPDVHLPAPGGRLGSDGRWEYHGLYIELKREHGGTVSAEQKAYIRFLREQGYAAEVCKGWEAAAQVIEAYLDGRYEPIWQEGRRAKA